ncbi:MAG: hypothetical protein PHP92_03985 [Candidatus Nanoarchaeia archaeon]|nr:hypothetical protein [Candidatus Nanoarchaeia archaeon]
MKIRIAFVSNSSSSSFTIRKSDLNGRQIEMIKNHIEEANKMKAKAEDFRECDRWDIGEDENIIDGYTTMDNFDMNWFLKEIGIEDDVVKWRDW